MDELAELLKGIGAATGGVAALIAAIRSPHSKKKNK